ncbi:MAG TPA: hypothetical protein VN325_30980 [Steroidobacteraceae bacterium]|nr:hypothetical protein [Steroidobacteraceae bacterium]
MIEIGVPVSFVTRSRAAATLRPEGKRGQREQVDQQTKNDLEEGDHQFMVPH